MKDFIISFKVIQLQHILNQVIAVRVFNELGQVLDDGVSEHQFLGWVALFEAPLHHATPVLVRAYLDAVAHAAVEDELSHHFVAFALGRLPEGAQQSLDHVVSVRVLQ